MKNLIFAFALALMSCSCGLTLAGSKGLEKRAAVISSTGCEIGGVDGWVRIPNVAQIPLPGPSYGDITFFHKGSDTLLFLSSVDKLDNAKEMLESLSASSKGAEGSNVTVPPEIPGAMERSLKVDGNEFRVIFVQGKKFTHVLQSMITSPAGQKPVSDLLKTFKSGD